MDPHIYLLILNVISVIIILTNAMILIFNEDIPHCKSRTLLLFNMLLGLGTRVAAIYITTVIIHAF